MEKLFDDTLFIQKERPTTITSQQEEKMYIDLAKECIKNQFSSDNEETIIEDLKELSIDDSGFGKAKDLESNGRACYEFDGEFIDWLDFIDYKRSEILEDNVKLWVEAHKPQPKFEKGEHLKVVNFLSRNLKINDIIYIIGFREKTAEYLVNSNPESSNGIILSYERVEKNCIINK